MSGCNVPGPQHRQRARAWAWCKQGGCAILDQSLFAGTNFLLNVLLARWLEAAAYGVFAVAYAVFLGLATLHTALLTEPMLIFGAGKYARMMPQYFRLLLHYGHWGVSGAMALLVGLAALLCWYCQASALANVLAALAFALPCILLQWLVRRALYVCGKPHWSAGGGVLYLGLILAGLQEAYRLHILTPAVSLVIMGAASLVVGLVLLYLVPTQPAASTLTLAGAHVLAAHWQYGKWASSTTAAIWVAREVSYPLLPLWVGLEGSAAVRALMNLLMPMLHINAALAMLIIPRCAAAWQAHGQAGLARYTSRALLIFASGAGLYWLGLYLCRRSALLWLYGGRYDAYADVLLLAGLLPLSEALLSVCSMALRASERPELVFWCHLLALGCTLTAGLWLMAMYGVVGAILGRLLASLVATAALCCCRTRSLPLPQLIQRTSTLDGQAL